MGLPGSFTQAFRNALFAASRCSLSTFISIMTCPCLALTARLFAFPKERLMPSESLSAPAAAIVLFSLSLTCG